MHSRDTFCLSVYGEGHYIADLKPNEEREVITRVSVSGSAEVYSTISARKSGESFWWDSGYIDICVIEEKRSSKDSCAFRPYAAIGKALEVEATIKGLQKGEGLSLEFWADTPSGKIRRTGENRDEGSRCRRRSQVHS